jgi:hypothetical protein
MTDNQAPDGQRHPGRGPVPDAVARDGIGLRGEAGSPLAVGELFLDAVNHPAGPNVHALRDLVTPESRDRWGDFSHTAAQLTGCGLTSPAEPAPGTDQVAYVRYVINPGYNLQASGDVPITAEAIGTLVHRPELGGWKVHQIGERLSAEDVPRYWSWAGRPAATPSCTCCREQWPGLAPATTVVGRVSRVGPR